MYVRYFSDSSGEQRRQALEDLGNWIARTDTLAGLAIAGAFAVGVRTWLRRRAKGPASALSARAVWFQRLVAMLRPYGYSLQESETPREFASRVNGDLGLRAGTRAVADVPTEWVEAYYELRYGDLSIEAGRRVALEERLGALLRVLKERG
jgi:hypothetical protein